MTGDRVRHLGGVTLEIEGEHVKLRSMHQSDTDAVVRWRNLPKIAQQMFADHGPTREEHSRWLAELDARGDRQEFVIVERATGHSVGTIGLSNIDLQNRRAEYGILIGAAEARGKGYAREASGLLLKYAFEQLELNRVYLHVFSGNAVAIRLYERLGFRHEGRLRQHARKNHAFQDVLVMAILTDEWK